MTSPGDPGDNSAGGRIGRHPRRSPLRVFAAPTEDADFNTLRPMLEAVACWRLDHIRFAFDSSVLVPEAREEVALLARIVGDHPDCPASVFGHADPVGDDDYNKKLAGRRASCIYALVTRDVPIWENLYSSGMGGDQWGVRSIQIMLVALQDDDGEHFYAGGLNNQLDTKTRAALKKFQSAKGLPASGSNDAGTRQKLFEAYMDYLCTPPAPPDAPPGTDPPFRMEKSAFLGKGADSGGKADYQGCGELNPVLVFSKSETSAFTSPALQGKRNAENAPNRRVVVFLFASDTRIVVDDWPCPKAADGAAGCKKRLWSDGDARRSPTDARRVYEKTLDTFACRFYDRMARRSPCERGTDGSSLSHVSFLLRSNSGCVPLANRTYKLTLSSDWTLQGTTDDEGLIEHEDIPPGDYKLEIDGHETVLPTLPRELSRRVHRVVDYFLFEDKA